MNLYLNIWRFIVMLSFSTKCFSDGQRFNSLGHLTVEPSGLFLIGSNLTVQCHLTRCTRSFRITLELNGQTVAPWKRVSCSTVEFKLINVQIPLPSVVCKLESDQVSLIVNGQTLDGGLPPDKPENVKCETSQSSGFIDCSWERGRETHRPRAYNISVVRKDGTRILLEMIRDNENVTIPRAKLDENTEHRLIITAYNHFGASQSLPFILWVKDAMVPETPHITQIKFGNSSPVAMLQWKTADSKELLRSYVRLRLNKGPWEEQEGTEPSEGVIQVDGLMPLADYEFQIKTCNSTHRDILSFTTSSRRASCSKWSLSFWGRSPGKGLSQQLHVWRMLVHQSTNGTMVTVLWKPPSPKDYSGEVHHYKICWGKEQKQEVLCHDHAALSQCSLQVPAEVRGLNISAVTLYGTSPPAGVPLGHSGDSGPVLREWAPAANGSALWVSWSQLENEQRSASAGEILHYVLEWTSVPFAELQWKQLSRNITSTFIKGLAAGVRYNISLYAVTTRGVHAPSSTLVYSKELKPRSGPAMSVIHEPRRIWIQWDELPVDQQRGFITNYTIYLQTLGSTNTKLNVSVSGSGPRQAWLDCPGGAVALQMSASTSAGEGPRGLRVSSVPPDSAAGVLVIVICFIITFFIVIIANLMCWSCVRKRIKKECISWGPACFDQKLPRLRNSMAIKLLEQDRSEPFFSSVYTDPPLSPISVISQSEEMDDVYPIIHVEVARVGSGHPKAEDTPLMVSDPRETLLDRLLEHDSYKPQISTLFPQGEEVVDTEEEQTGTQSSVEVDRYPGVLGSLGDFLSRVEVGVSDSPHGPSLGSISSLLLPKTQETSVFDGGFSLDRMEIGDDVEVLSTSLDLQKGGIVLSPPVSEDFCSPQCTVEATRTGGYFPQVVTVSTL